MKRLTKMQIEYAEKRIGSIVYDKKKKAEKSLTNGVRLTAEKRATLLRQGKVKLKKGVKEIFTYTDVVDVFDFLPFEPKTDKKTLTTICEKLDKEMIRLRDELILGDAEQAMKMIEALEKSK